MFEGVNTHISGVTIARNTFRHFNPDAVGVQEDSSGDTGNGVVIEDNTFAGNEIPIELGIAGNASRLTGTQIIGNTITPNSTTTTVTGTGGSGISIDSNARNGTIDQTLIEDNAISGPATLLLIQAAATVPPLSGAGDVISNTQIINNVLNPTATGAGGIGLIGGDSTTSPPSRISGVTIENDTIVNDQGNAGLFHSVPNKPGASGNQITDVTVRNSILYEPVGIPIFVTSCAGSQPSPGRAHELADQRHRLGWHERQHQQRPALRQRTRWLTTTSQRAVPQSTPAPRSAHPATISTELGVTPSPTSARSSSARRLCLCSR